MQDDVPPLIVTLALEERAFLHFNALRQQYFPPGRNWIPAHVTLFHKLPGLMLDDISKHLQDITATQDIFQLSVTGLQFMGNGVAFALEAEALKMLRRELARHWWPWLMPQDRQNGFRPHVIVQNKVAADIARGLHEKLQAEFTPWHFNGIGLDLWHYRGGPWEPAGRFLFRQ